MYEISCQITTKMEEFQGLSVKFCRVFLVNPSRINFNDCSSYKYGN
jgi:hypothetical protein